MRRGGVLLETMLAMALFTAAAGFTFITLRDSSSSVERIQQRNRALGVASNQLAKIESGEVSIDEAGDIEGEENNDFRVEIEISPSSFEELSLVTVMVFDASNETNNEEYLLAELSALLSREVDP